MLLIDDSAVVRGVWRRILEPEPDIEVVASAENGRVGVAAVSTSPADVAILDIEMPEMDGLTALPLLRAACPGLKIIMASTLTTRGAKVTLRALSLGAADYIAKPTALMHGGALTSVAQELIAKVRALGRPARRGPEAVAPRAAPQPSAVMPRVLAIASSTGGPNALSTVLRGLPAGFTLPVLIAQHMPPTFTAMLAEHLGKDSGRPSCQAESGMPIKGGENLRGPGRLSHDRGRHQARSGHQPQSGAAGELLPTGRRSAPALGGRRLRSGGPRHRADRHGRGRSPRL